MKYRYKHVMTLIAIILFTACTRDELDVSPDGKKIVKSDGVISLTTARNDATLSLSIDALDADRANVWIDLNADGVRSADGSEDVKLFNSFENYALSPSMKTVLIYGKVTYLGCASNELTAIDVSRNPFLTTLNCPLNQLTSIDISKNPLLTRLDCSGNLLSTLNVSSNPALVSLWCFNNQLSSLDIVNNARLAFLDCSGNALTLLDVSKNNKLKRLLCYNNQLAALDVSQNQQLNVFWAFGNLFSETAMLKILSSLKTMEKGDLWISDKSLSKEQEEIALLKGWKQH